MKYLNNEEQKKQFNEEFRNGPGTHLKVVVAVIIIMILIRMMV